MASNRRRRVSAVSAIDGVSDISDTFALPPEPPKPRVKKEVTRITEDSLENDEMDAPAEKLRLVVQPVQESQVVAPVLTPESTQVQALEPASAGTTAASIVRVQPGPAKDAEPRQPVFNAMSGAPTPEKQTETHSGLLSFSKVISETDLTRADGRGVYDDFRSCITSVRYPEDTEYSEILPLDFSSGFNSGLSKVNVQIGRMQREVTRKACRFLSDQIKFNRGTGEKIVSSSTSSMLHRTMQDFFIAHAPQDCFVGATGEQMARQLVGLPPLPELSIFEHALKSFKPVDSLTPSVISETSLDLGDSEGVYDGFTSNVPQFKYPRRVKYSEYLPLRFTNGFNSGMERIVFQMTSTQIDMAKLFGDFLTRQIRTNTEKRVIRAIGVSMLHRTIIDFFFMNAPAGCMNGVMGEQQLRANVGLPPLPELEIYEYEMRRRAELARAAEADSSD